MTGCHGLHTPPQVVSSSEHAQIVSRLDGFLESFLALSIDLPKLRFLITKPLRPMWITPESHIPTTDLVFDDFHPVICCTASRRVLGGEVSEGGYIQGSGDDTENWAFGLTSAVFWANPQLLLSTPEPELPELISKLVAQASTPQESPVASQECVPPTSIFHITTIAKLTTRPMNPGGARILLNTDMAPMIAAEISPRELHIDLGPHKIGSKKLRTILPAIIDFVAKRVAQGEPKITDITVACSSGRDHSVGVGLALLCLFFDNDGQLKGLDEHQDEEWIDKLFIRRRLGWIMTAMPHVNPTGATLQSVNSYLMGRPS
jgi:tRNA A64-2'-O-ribosylphosphate transferase